MAFFSGKKPIFGRTRFVYVSRYFYNSFDYHSFVCVRLVLKNRAKNERELKAAAPIKLSIENFKTRWFANFFVSKDFSSLQRKMCNSWNLFTFKPFQTFNETITFKNKTSDVFSNQEYSRVVLPFWQDFPRRFRKIDLVSFHDVDLHQTHLSILGCFLRPHFWSCWGQRLCSDSPLEIATSNGLYYTDTRNPEQLVLPKGKARHVASTK